MPLPSIADPSMNVTVPVGVPAPGATTVTVAVKVTGWLRIDGLDEELTAVLVEALLTVWTKSCDVLPLKLLSPS